MVEEERTSVDADQLIRQLRADNERLRDVERTARAALPYLPRGPLYRDLAYALMFAVDNGREALAIPSSIFRAADDRADLYLLAIKPDGSVSLDGGHSTPQGVAKARKLFERIATIRPPEGTRYLMLTVQEAPAPGGDVNREAIATLNRSGPGGGDADRR